MHKLFGYKVVNRFWFSCHTVEEFWNKEIIKGLTNMWCHRLDTALSFPCHWRKPSYRQSDWNRERKIHIRQTHPGHSVPCLIFQIAQLLAFLQYSIFQIAQHESTCIVGSEDIGCNVLLGVPVIFPHRIMIWRENLCKQLPSFMMQIIYRC